MRSNQKNVPLKYTAEAKARGLKYQGNWIHVFPNRASRRASERKRGKAKGLRNWHR